MQPVLKGNGPNHNIIYAFSLVLDMSNDLIVSSGVAVTLRNVSLWGGLILIPAPRCYERCEMSVIWMDGNTVVVIPGV